MKIALVVPHIFMHQEILPDVIFSPGHLALDLAKNLVKNGQQVTIFSPGPLDDVVDSSWQKKRLKHISADLTLFEAELEQRGYGYVELLKKHPLIFITLARQVQSEIITQAYQAANQGQFDLVHVWCNEEELALVNACFCQVPTVFNHHEPFNFLARYRSIFSKYKHLNWISFSHAQRQTLDQDANFVGNIYHGLRKERFSLNKEPADYLLYMGRVIKPKGVHYAIAASKKLGVKLKIAGKHYAGHSKDQYWREFVEPELEGGRIDYVGFVKEDEEKQDLLGKAKVLLMPSTWQEPFGMVMIEALACGTPVVGFDQGSIPEIVQDGKTGYVVEYQSEEKVVKNGQRVSKNFNQLKKDPNFKRNVALLSRKVEKVDQIKRENCRREFEKRFTLEKMAKNYEQIYQKLIKEK